MPTSAYSEKARTKISRHVRKHRREGMPKDQAVAAAMSEARREGKKVPSRRRKSASRKSASRKSATRKSATRKSATRKSATRKTARKQPRRAKAKAGRKGGKAKARKSR